MANGQWSMVNGQWSMVNGQWPMANQTRHARARVGRNCACPAMSLQTRESLRIAFNGGPPTIGH
jgi:hypothetical protein